MNIFGDDIKFIFSAIWQPCDYFNEYSMFARVDDIDQWNDEECDWVKKWQIARVWHEGGLGLHFIEAEIGMQNS